MDKLEKIKKVKDIWLERLNKIDKEFLNMKDVMRITGFEYGKVYYHFNVLGLLEGEQICKGGKIMFTKDSVRRYIDNL